MLKRILLSTAMVFVTALAFTEPYESESSIEMEYYRTLLH